MPVREWARAEGYTVNPVIKTNKNGYPFLTLKKIGTPAGEGGENLYFSKDAASRVGAGESVTSAMFDEMLVCEVKNAGQEDRLKLAFKGESQFIEL